MKRIILIICGMIILSTMVIGCSKNNTKVEAALINKANSIIEERYNVEISKDDYIYSLGEDIGEDKFAYIDETKYPEMVFLRGMSKDGPINGEVFDFSVKFNTTTGEVISSECLIYE